MKPLVIKVVDVAYGGENGLNQAIQLAEDSLQSVKFMREKNLISKFFENIDTDSGLVVYGIEDTMKALVSGAVETIVCWEGLTQNRVVMRDKETGEGNIIKYIREEEMNDPRHKVDAKT